MRLLIFNFEYPPLGGGGGVATRDISEELARGSHEVHIITTRHTGLLSEEVRNDVHIHRVPVWGRQDLPTATLLSLLTFVPMAWWRGWQLARRQRFDVINAQFVVPSGIPALLLAKLTRTPFVLSFIGGDVYDPTKGTSPHRHATLRWLIRLIASGATARTAISADTARRAKELLGVTGDITVTHLGLLPSTVSAASRVQLGLSEDVPIFVSIGRLIPRKGYEVLLAAWQEVPRAHLVVIGSGPLAESLKELTRELGIADRVRFSGFVSETRKLQFLAASDGYVSSAQHEGFGLVFLEAMAAGLPIVAGDNGGHTDYLVDQENALLVNTTDAKELARALRQLLANESKRHQMGRLNKERVVDFMIDKTTAVFEEVLTAAQHKPEV